MASTILSDNGVSSGSAGLKSTADSTGVLALQTTTSGGAATTALTIDTSQNVGIGITPSTSASSRKLLQIGGASASVSTLAMTNGISEILSNTVYDGTNFKYITTNYAASFDYNNAATGGFAWRLAPSGTAGNNVTLTEAMRITSAGYVGIGTTSPQNALVVSSAGAGGVEIDPSGYISSYNRSTSANQDLYIRALQQYFYSNGTERMRIDSSGNVGIGTTSPLDRLDVVSASSAYRNRIRNSGANEATLLFQNSSTGTATNDGLYLGIIASMDAYLWNYENNPVIFGTNNTERMRIDSSGNLLVGTTGLSANGKLTVNGQSRFYESTSDATAASRFDKSSATTTTSQVFVQFTVNNQGSGSGQINANGASQAAFGSFSDLRLKENIIDLPPQLEKVMSLRPVEFDYKTGGHQTGFIAQEMQQVFPDAVGNDDSEEHYLTVTGWNKTEAILVKAIQEQQALITAQAETINALTARVVALEAK